MARSILLVCFFLCVGIAQAQQLTSKHFTTLDGLPNNAVRSLYFDSRGWLWVGTENGVSKMQNGEFMNFDESDGLAFNSCWAIEEDSKGQMWFGSYGGGVTLFDGKGFTAFDKDKGLVNNKVRKIFSLKDKIYIGTENGLSVMDIHSHEILTVAGSVSDHPQNYISLIFEHRGRLFYSTYGNGLFEVSWQNGRPQARQLHQHNFMYSANVIGEQVFVGNKGFMELFQIDGFLAGEQPGKSFGQSVAWHTLKTNDGNVFTAAWGLYTKDGGVFKVEDGQMVDMSVPFGITSKGVLALAYDHTRNILYAGTNDKGLFKVHLDGEIVYKDFKERATLGVGISGLHRAILHDEGMSIRDPETKRITELGLREFKKAEAAYVAKNKANLPKHEDHFFELNFGLPASDIEFYEIHGQGSHFWVNSNIGIFKIDRQGKIVAYLPVHAMHIGFTPDGRLIESNPYGGVRIYEDPETMDYRYYHDSLPHTPVQVTKIVTTPNKTFFASVFHGLYQLENGKFTSLLKEGLWPVEKLKRMDYNHKLGQLNIATEFGDVYVAEVEPEFKVIHKIGKENLTGSSVMLLEAFEDHLVIATEKGVNVYHEGRVRFFDEEQGFKNRIFTTSEVLDDKVYMGTTRGYYEVNLRELLQKEFYNFTLSLSDVQVNHQPLDPAGFTWFAFASNTLELGAKENTLTLEFTPNGHPYPGKLQYRYRLKEEDDWSRFQSSTRLTLPYLPADDYRIEIEAWDRHSDTLTAHPLLNVKVHPPIYFQWWFVALGVIWSSLIVFGVYKIRMKRVRAREQKKAAIEKRLVETKLEALRSQMNPHFTFNAMNSLQYLILKGDKDIASEFLIKFSGLIRRTLEYSSQQRITLAQEISYLQAYIEIENNRVDNRIGFEVQVDEQINIEETVIPPMLLQPFVENVFVHAFDRSHPNPKFSLHFGSTEEGNLICEVADNGMGMNAGREKKLHASKGLSLVRERLELLKGGVENPFNIRPTPGGGTTVQLILPKRFLFAEDLSL